MNDKNWEIKQEMNVDKINELLDDGWEPFGVWKGDWVVNGFSVGWALAHETYYFKKRIREKPIG